jgi:hypothetical protein
MVSQSVSMSRYRTHFETCDQILFCVRRFLSESCCLVSVGRPLWREVGSVICHSQSIVIYQYLHQAFSLHVFYSSAIYTYVQYIQSFIQSRLSADDYALLVIISPNYRSNQPSNLDAHATGRKTQEWKIMYLMFNRYLPIHRSVFEPSTSQFFLIFFNFY